jgi:1-acyl-sn-glycerol-3-phosphate acyltransferase
MVWRARLAVVSLWVSQTARVLADCALGTFVVFELYRAWPTAWQLVIALAMLPTIVLAPLIGTLGNSLPRREILGISAFYCVCIVVLFTLLHGHWLAAWALICVGGAVYGPTLRAMLPAAAQETRIPLARLNACMSLGSAIAILSGIMIATDWHRRFSPGINAMIVLAGIYLLVLVTAWPARFSSDLKPPEGAGLFRLGFFRDGKRIWRDPEARGSLLALAAVRGLILGILGAATAFVLEGSEASVSDIVEVYLPPAGWLMGGVALGSLVAGLQRHPRRVLGLVPCGAAGLAIALIFMAAGMVLGPVLGVVLGAMWGLVNVPLAAMYQAALPADARGNGMALRNFADYLAIAITSLLMYILARQGLVPPEALLWLAALVAAIGAALSWRLLLLEVLEIFVEILIWPMYRIRAHGPGLHQVPPRGPLLILANHSSWLDPIWVAKVVPRRVIPMMTSMFYDLPGLKPLMQLAGVIRVQAATYRRDVPEIDEAITALDRGDCVLLFPEGWMRRYDDRPLRQFGQGIARILKERPQTPVIVCWIEGGWGSYFSHRGGPPTKNKRFDWWRRIDIAIEPPHVIDPALIGQPRALRSHLMQTCLEARGYLGLAPIDPEKAPQDSADSSDEALPG